MAKVCILMGSDSDLPVMSKAAAMLEKFGIDYEMKVISAHREPDVFVEYAKSAESKGTYPQIKAYVLEHSGLKVSNLYISQIKRKCGIEVGKNYNLPKSEDSRQPQCPPEKEKAIRETFKYFGMI